MICWLCYWCHRPSLLTPSNVPWRRLTMGSCPRTVTAATPALSHTSTYTHNHHCRSTAITDCPTVLSYFRCGVLRFRSPEGRPHRQTDHRIRRQSVSQLIHQPQNSPAGCCKQEWSIHRIWYDVWKWNLWEVSWVFGDTWALEKVKFKWKELELDWTNGLDKGLPLRCMHSKSKYILIKRAQIYLKNN